MRIQQTNFFFPALFPILFIALSLMSTHLCAASIETTTLIESKKTRWIELDSKLEAVKAATVSAQTSGRIIKLNYDVNDIVTEGAPLLEITSKEQGAELAAAEADYAKAIAQNNEAQQQRRRYETLFPKGAISQGAMDEAIANAKSTQEAVRASKARIIQATESLKYTVVNAPFSGIVTKRHVEQGETVSPGQPLFSGFSTSQMRAITHVPERYIDALKQLPEFKVTLNDGRQFTSSSLTIFSFADPQSHSYKVRINLPENEPNLMPGMWAKAKFSAGTRSTILIPTSALLKQNELSAVYLKQGDDFVLNQVRLGHYQDKEVEVLAGLSPGDVIASDAYQALQNRQAK
ncbi:efflux RND transporter periplasmic adaptor subunit [Shewanella canadensis]|uniref:Efflux RND transporter periplasmic adaptor subunit n=1 Tax=Shewanella canadensis TaxID=271096 RepID=A0A431WNG7_9GAMM|nr:efflux RND transporter periplasmic adaptor subunit [Shewanella canadensis]RTR36805.1 efflux RND transporter periplasmic adaptor subunit [Shewanella canadensis]